MRQFISNWEGVLLLFIVISAVFTGIAYVVSINFATPIPWLAILLAALLITLGIRARRARGHGISGNE